MFSFNIEILCNKCNKIIWWLKSDSFIHSSECVNPLEWIMESDFRLTYRRKFHNCASVPSYSNKIPTLYWQCSSAEWFTRQRISHLLQICNKRGTNVSNKSFLISKWKKEWASSQTPHSNIAWECCIQWLAIQALVTGNQTKKGI